MSRGGEAERPGGPAGVRRAARYHRVGSYVDVFLHPSQPPHLGL
ncbi:hypothetical protein QC762_119305 [Podospora pseudocomata]|uniref:Uncharacterized protein n=1 Tax=Podospora pseudocomata TaxID=2093779 RepID=A0ABR0GXT3_9PEZI|nr:hypothetical protein QC762_119305 [Podospora pseudocomata]